MLKPLESHEKGGQLDASEHLSVSIFVMGDLSSLAVHCSRSPVRLFAALQCYHRGIEGSYRHSG